jgi:alpha-ribazole phosphatase
VGSTDESLTENGRKKLKSRQFPTAEKVYVSPLKRCIETAEIIYSEADYIICNDLRECDFGDFEYKNYIELKDNPDYQKFIDSFGECGFPNGETKAEFSQRCVRAFEKIMQNEDNNKTESIAFVVHGGTIMAIMEKFAKDKKNYYDWQCKNGEGYSCEFDGGDIVNIDSIN